MNHAVRPERVSRPMEDGRGGRGSRSRSKRRVQRLAQFLSVNCEILVEVAIVSGLLEACARICGRPNLLSSALFWPTHFASGLLNEEAFLSEKTVSFLFSANTCISTTIVACYINNNSSGRARGEVLRIDGEHGIDASFRLGRTIPSFKVQNASTLNEGEICVLSACDPKCATLFRSM